MNNGNGVFHGPPCGRKEHFHQRILVPVFRALRLAVILVSQAVMMTSSNGSIYRVAGPLCGEVTCYRWRGALMISLICDWTNGWVNSQDTGDLRRHRPHYDIPLMVDFVRAPRTVLHSVTFLKRLKLWVWRHRNYICEFFNICVSIYTYIFGTICSSHTLVNYFESFCIQRLNRKV